MHLVYIDDSYSKGHYCFSAIAIPSVAWREVFDSVKEWRRQLNRQYGIYMHTEMHATDLVGGRGKISASVVTKWERSKIYKSGLAELAAHEPLRIFNSCSSWSMEQSYEYLLNRINRTMQAWDSHAILICDEGDQSTYTRLTRRMNAFNYIPSRYGSWGDGSRARNIPIERILEDPVFKDSKKSYFVQLADFMAFAILQKERPIPSRKKYGLHQAWKLARPRFVLQATTRDPDGIIR